MNKFFKFYRKYEVIINIILFVTWFSVMLIGLIVTTNILHFTIPLIGLITLLSQLFLLIIVEVLELSE